MRPEVVDAIRECRGAGIRPVMITGDHKDTAVAIAKELGILEAGWKAVTGAEIDQLSDEELDRRIENMLFTHASSRSIKCGSSMRGSGKAESPR